MDVTLPVDVGDEERVLLVPRHENDFARVGTVAEVVDRVRLPGGARAVAAERPPPRHRGRRAHRRRAAACASRSRSGPTRPDASDGRIRELEREYRAIVEEILELRGDDGRIAVLRPLDHGAGRARRHRRLRAGLHLRRRRSRCSRQSTSASGSSSPSASSSERLAELQVRRRIREDVESGAQKQQRDYVLRRQMESIRKELGEDDGSVVEEYRTKIEEAGMPEEVRAQAERELTRLEAIGEQSPEASIIRTYLDWLIAVPWSKRSEERLDPVHAREVLDADHAGLEDVKDRIVEYLAVRKLRQERGITEDKRSGAILTLIGPPGTGKTSVGESIARALGREFVRMSLGGVRDEAEIRGHRRTYIGALPGRLVRALRDAGTMNPVIMLDEVDKVGADWRGDPSAALLEVLDPAQNHSFRDHYLDVELDLSEVVFIATANIADTIPGPLLDRMEVIRFDGYTVDEKVAIARGYLWPRQRERNGLREDEVDDHRRGARARRLRVHARGGRPPARARAREAPAQDRDADRRRAGRGRRSRSTSTHVRDALGRQRFFQEAAERTAVPGVATGLAVTGTGGDVLFVEATVHARADGTLPADRPARRRDEGVGADRALLRSRARGGARDRRVRLRRPRVPRPRPRRRDPEGRPERGHHDGDRARVAPLGAARAAHRRHDRRGDAPGPRAPDRRPQAEGARRPRGRAHRRRSCRSATAPTSTTFPRTCASEMAFHPVMSLGEVLDLALEPESARPPLSAV